MQLYMCIKKDETSEIIIKVLENYYLRLLFIVNYEILRI